jgi:hypothetical protein
MPLQTSTFRCEEVPDDLSVIDKEGLPDVLTLEERWADVILRDPHRFSRHPAGTCFRDRQGARYRII